MTGLHLTSLLQSPRKRSVLSFALALSLTSPIATSLALGQTGHGNPPASASPIVGKWGTTVPREDGGTLYTFEEYGPGGTWRMTTIVQGGPASGKRSQAWGSYTAQQTGGMTYRVSTKVTGFAPAQVCTPGAGCQPLPPVASHTSVRVFTDSSHLSLEGSRLVSERVAQIPAELTDQLPQKMNLAGTSPDVRTPLPGTRHAQAAPHHLRQFAAAAHLHHQRRLHVYG